MQALNEVLSMLDTPVGIVKIVNPVHPLNAVAPMLVTVDGMVMLVRPVLVANALAAIAVTLKTMVETVIVDGIDTDALVAVFPELTAAVLGVPGDNV